MWNNHPAFLPAAEDHHPLASTHLVLFPILLKVWGWVGLGGLVNIPGWYAHWRRIATSLMLPTTLWLRHALTFCISLCTAVWVKKIYPPPQVLWKYFTSDCQLPLIGHNFVKVSDNWITFCNVVYIWTYHRFVKFCLKIFSHWRYIFRKPQR